MSIFQKFMSRKVLFVAPILLGIAAIFLAPMFKSKPAQVEQAERAVKVRVLKVSPLDVVPRAVGYGTVAPGRSWEAVAEVAGQVVWKSDALKNGNTVAQGTELLRIEDADYRLELAQIEAQLGSAEVKDKTTRASLAIAEKDLKLLQDDYKRKASLAKKGAVSTTSVEAAERQMLSGETQVQNLKNTLAVSAAERQSLIAQKQRAELDLRRTVLAAPFEVRVTDVKISEAQYANKGQLLFSADGLEVAEIAAQYPIGVLRPLVSAALQGGADLSTGVLGLDAVVRLRTPSHMVEWPARIDRVAGAIDAQTQSIGIVVAIDDPAAQAAPGQRPKLLRNTFVEVELIAPAMAKTVAVPSSALHDGAVYVVDAENRLVMQKVQVAFAQKSFTVLKGGVKPGQQIVTSDLPSAIQGMLLEPQEDKKTKRQLVVEATGSEPMGREPQK